MGTLDAGRVYDDLPTRKREQRSWYWYEWAQSAFVTTISVVLALPYLTAHFGPDSVFVLPGIGVAVGLALSLQAWWQRSGLARFLS